MVTKCETWWSIVFLKIFSWEATMVVWVPRGMRGNVFLLGLMVALLSHCYDAGRWRHVHWLPVTGLMAQQRGAPGSVPVQQLWAWRRRLPEPSDEEECIPVSHMNNLKVELECESNENITWMTWALNVMNVRKYSVQVVPGDVAVDEETPLYLSTGSLSNIQIVFLSQMSNLETRRI